MPVFTIKADKLYAAELQNFALEKELQTLIEKNLETVFNCRFVASEFSTGAQHAGRIDSLALSEDNNPVIIEYKKVESSELINQSLFYLHWIYDHKGDFEIAAQKALGKSIVVDWSAVRVICIAPDYKKYDLHAVQVMGANIELWRYRRFANHCLFLEEVLHSSKTAQKALTQSPESSYKNPVMVEAGRKAALTRANGSYTFEERLQGKSLEIKRLAENIQTFILDLDDAIEEVPKKYYVAYKTSQNIVCMEVNAKQIKLFLKLTAQDIPLGTKNYRDVSAIGHYGTGDIEVTLASEVDFEAAKALIVMAYNKLGG